MVSYIGPGGPVVVSLFIEEAAPGRELPSRRVGLVMNGGQFVVPTDVNGDAAVWLSFLDEAWLPRSCNAAVAGATNRQEGPEPKLRASRWVHSILAVSGRAALR